MPHTAQHILQDDASRVDAFLKWSIESLPDAPPRLIEAIQYSLFSGGKRVRPALVIESFRACTNGEVSPTVLACAAAVELVHTFSLVHDDLPSMDDDDLRRGKPTSHKVFGEALAILAGDAMLALAFEVLSRGADASLVPALVRELASATGSIGMIGGQVRDIEGEKQSLNLEQLSSLHRMKTGALITASCRMGAICARADESTLQRITDLAGSVGLAFQIVDDLLDAAGGEDDAHGKNTFPTLLGVEKSREFAQREIDRALTLSGSLPHGATLAALIRFVLERKT